MKRTAVLAAFLLGIGPGSAGSAAQMPKVFVVHSYEPGNVCGQPQHDGVMDALTEAGFRPGETVWVKTYYMDTKRRHITPEAIRAQGAEALERIRSFRPDVVVTLDDNAFRTVALALLDTPVQVVFSGVNTPLDQYNRDTRFMESRTRPGHNITGVYEKLHFVDAVRVHCRIVPDTRKVIFLSDNSPTGRAIRSQVLLELVQENLPVAFEMRVTDRWEEYQAIVGEIDALEEPVVLYPGALRLVAADGSVRTAREILPWTVAHCRKPAIAINYAFMAGGLFGGAAVDFRGMGRQAGRMVARILRGARAGEIPVEDAERVALVFNLDRAMELGILPPDEILLAADEIIRSRRASSR